MTLACDDLEEYLQSERRFHRGHKKFPKGHDFYEIVKTDILIHEVIGYGSRKIQMEESDPESRGRSAAVAGSIPVKEAASEPFEWRELDEGQLDREEG